MTLSGCGTALVTPFRGDGSLDEETLSKLVEWQIESGIHFLVACGTTAETPTLNHEEWLRAIGIVTEAAAGEYRFWRAALTIPPSRRLPGQGSRLRSRREWPADGKSFL